MFGDFFGSFDWHEESYIRISAGDYEDILKEKFLCYWTSEEVTDNRSICFPNKFSKIYKNQLTETNVRYIIGTNIRK